MTSAIRYPVSFPASELSRRFLIFDTPTSDLFAPGASSVPELTSSAVPAPVQVQYLGPPIRATNDLGMLTVATPSGDQTIVGAVVATPTATAAAGNTGPVATASPAATTGLFQSVSKAVSAAPTWLLLAGALLLWLMWGKK